MVNSKKIKLIFLNDPLLYIFMGLAVVIRVIFWLYTDRIWEDCLITLTPVENAWNGFGLTHHISEPRVHSFTSPISVLIPLLLYPLMNGILALRIVSLLATAGTILLAYKICGFLNFKAVAKFFVLAFLSFDFLHIFFGMAGMETQVAVFFILMAMYYFLKTNRKDEAGKQNQIFLGLSLGFCMLSRPDFALPCAAIGFWFLFTNPKMLAKIILFALVVYLPWIVFATLYYGSPIPNTIIAKSQSSGVMKYLKNILSYLMSTGDASTPIYQSKVSGAAINSNSIFSHIKSGWYAYAPIYEWWWYKENNFISMSKVGVVLEVLLALVGAICGIKKNIKFLLFPIIFILFAVYNLIFVHIPYYMWYLPPFTALLCIIIAAGLNVLSETQIDFPKIQFKFNRVALILGVCIIALYVYPLPYFFSIEKNVQQYVEVEVRQKTGERLNVLMQENDTVVLEPLGYIGYYARNKTIYDFPGLSSKIALSSIAKSGPLYGLSQLCNDLSPSFIVLRPAEYESIRKDLDNFDGNYHLLEIVEQTKIKEFVSGPFRVFNSDMTFMIFKRNPDTDYEFTGEKK
jgi:hypothetical protein